MAESTDSVELPDCEYESLLELFRFLYSDAVNLTGSNVLRVHRMPCPARANLRRSNYVWLVSQTEVMERKKKEERVNLAFREREISL